MCEATEEELLIASLLEPRYRPFPMRVTVPQQRQPYVASRKFNVFINFFVREVYLRAFGDDERESQALAARASAFEDHALGSGHEQFADRAPPRAAPAVSVPDKGEPEDPR